MKENLTEVIAIYSGNIPANDFVEAAKLTGEKLKVIKDIPREVRFTVCSFGADGANYKKVCENLPVEKLSAKKLFSAESGCELALIDSAAGLIDAVGERYRGTPEHEIPGRIIFVIIAFGKDNASRKHTYDQLREVIGHQSGVYGWEFYLITDTPFVAEKLGFAADRTIFAASDTQGAFPRALGELCEILL
ncbi:MAG: hypothetical protein LBI36_03120 [Oscillospiraceae bacterium]|jgi:hypothetical protein|nr:hypothetical protein [Oscillospiraceae bacterium]